MVILDSDEVFDLSEILVIGPAHIHHTDPGVEGPKLSLIWGCIAAGLLVLISSLEFITIPNCLLNLPGISGKERVWMATGYLIGGLPTQLLYGQLVNTFNIKYVLLSSQIVYAMGSLGSGIIGNTLCIIIFRIISGLGGGSFILIVLLTITTHIPQSIRGRALGLISILFGLGLLLSPIIQQLISSQLLKWNQLFYITSTLSIISLAITVKKIGLDSGYNSSDWVARFDFLGAISLIVSVVCLILAFNFKSGQAWSSIKSLLPVSISAISLILFLIVQWKLAKYPIIPRVALVRNTICCVVISFLLGAIIFDQLLFRSRLLSDNNIWANMSLIFGLVFGYLLSGLLLRIYGNLQKALLVLGSYSSLLTSVYLGWFSINIIGDACLRFIMGLGLGLTHQTVLILCQKSMLNDKELITIVTGFLTFSQWFGGLLGMSLAREIIKSTQPLDKLSTYLLIPIFLLSLIVRTSQPK